MLSAPILKGLSAYLSSLDAVSAIYDENFNLVSTESKDFFEKLDIEAVRSPPPIKEETFYTVEADGEKMILSVTPIFKSKRIVTAYTFVVRTDYQLYKQTCAGTMPDYAALFLDRIKKGICDCSELNELAREGNGSKKILSLLEAQQDVIDKLYSELSETRYSAFPSKSVNSRLNCNISALLETLCSDTAESLKEVKRKVNADIDTRNYYSKIDFNLFTAAFSNLLRYHIRYSPLKSPINIKSAVNSENLFELTVKTKVDDKKFETREDTMLAQYFRDFAYKIICYDFGGEFETDIDGDSIVSIVRLPVAKKNRGSLLTDKNSAYLGSDYKPMRTNLAQIIEDETAALKSQRSSKKSDKR